MWSKHVVSYLYRPSKNILWELIPEFHYSFNVCIRRICHIHEENTHSRWREVFSQALFFTLPSISFLPLPLSRSFNRGEGKSWNLLIIYQRQTQAVWTRSSKWVQHLSNVAARRQAANVGSLLVQQSGSIRIPSLEKLAIMPPSLLKWAKNTELLLHLDKSQQADGVISGEQTEILKYQSY